MEVYFINNPPTLLTTVAKVIRTEAHKLPALRCVSYHVIHTKSYQGHISSTTLRPPSHQIYQRLGYISYQVYEV